MSDDPRIERLESKIAQLEAGLEELRDAFAGMARAKAQEPAQAAPTPYRSSSESLTGEVRSKTVNAPRIRRPVDLERWLGRNALLVVGVLALVAAVGFTLKYAFDQGWISPAARVLAGLVAGGAVAGYGEHLYRRGMGRYGAGLQAAGAAIGYLSVWAAAGPFRFVPAGVGIVGLALISGLVLANSLRTAEAYLSGLAAAGAYLAPLLLGSVDGGGNLVLGYSILVSAAAGVVAAVRRWPGTCLVVILGFSLLAIVADEPDPAFFALYAAIGGGLLLWTAQHKGWQWQALLIWALSWSGLLLTVDTADAWRAWAFVAAPVALVVPIWIVALKSPVFGAIPKWDDLSDDLRGAVFYGTALLWPLVATRALPGASADYPLAVAAVLAMPYLVPAAVRGQAAMHLAGLAVLVLGISLQWDGLAVAAALAAVALLSAVATRSGPLAENRWIASALLAFATYALFEAEAGRAADYPALTGAWAGVLYLLVAATVSVAGPLWKRTEDRWERPAGFPLRTATWLLAALQAVAGGTTEIPAFVVQHGGSDLAAGLAVSVYWLVLAGGLLAYGFWKESRAVRITGLVMGALALGKVLAIDLAELRALYRVGSLALLALIALLGARAYYRKEPTGE